MSYLLLDLFPLFDGAANSTSQAEAVSEVGALPRFGGLRIYLTPNGVQKVDAPISSDEERTRAFEFLASRASEAIKELDVNIRIGKLPQSR
jgi:hypothetical protein